MRSIRRLRRPDLGSGAAASDLLDDGDSAAWTATADSIPRDLLPADHRHRAERPALARRLRQMAHPRFYAAQVGDPALAGDVDATTAHFLGTGIRDGARVSGLFNPDVYCERLAARGLGVASGVDPFLHWLTVGWDERIVPTVLFDEEFYVARHPDLANGQEWAFAQYVRAGSYAPGRSPTHFGPNYAGVPAPDARERQDPPLVNGLLHRAEDYDIKRSSWIEEGVVAGAAKLAVLDSPRMRDLVAKAAAIEPMITEPPRERWVSWPPHTHPMLLPTARAEGVRRQLGLVRADTVVVVPGGGGAGAGLAAVASALHEAEPGATVLVATTDHPAHPDLGIKVETVDLREPWAGATEQRRLLGLLDLVRGVQPRRLVVAESALGWRLLSSYGTTLRNEMSLAVVLTAPDGSGVPIDDFQGCFDRLDWVVTDTDAQRDELAGRYLLSGPARDRLISAADCADALADLATRGADHG
ncbi:hypothetical protein F0U44_08365 [Nocardioides humilatus]|uniref:Uncharacterized protein n=1 Tax=Nocardioides humilatus TaxID=2607660 RepID=A0A5B1LCP3_9ACTN|nr:hypothetical protein [Nocardioides humilatus]KAA1418513.1 hypothetical protein F0U44_08365 [Nocardioides humilatus]